MAVSLTGSKTVNTNVSPTLTAATLTTLLAIPLELMTVGQFKQIADAIRRVPLGNDPATVIGSILR